MSKYLALPNINFGKLGLWLKKPMISDVPPDFAFCEFGCRKTQCRFDEWSHCKNRLSYVAAHAEGASLPASSTLDTRAKYDALLAAGAPEKLACAAALNPDIFQAVASTYLRPSR